MMSETPDIFAYIDYRRWLADLSEYRKATTRFFSHRWLAQAAGIKNPSFFSQVVAGKRNLTPAMTERFAGALDLKEKEALFFRHLVRFNQATTAMEKQEHYALLRELAGSVRQTLLGEDSWDFYGHWWIPAVRELLELRGSFENWAQLASWLRPGITARQAREAVELLERLGLVRRDQEGRWRQVHKDLTTGEEVRSLAVRRHNREMAELGAQAVERFPLESRHVSGVTLGLSEAGYRMLSAEILAFRERVVRIADRDRGASEVYQCNVQLFPLSKGSQS